MFIDTLEFTFPVDLCALFSTLQQQGQTQMEFPASVNSYGTTQDASIIVALRSNKITLKVDGVSSNASIISKSESTTLKLSVFDVDRSLLQQEENVNNSSTVHNSQSVTPSNKRPFDDSVSFHEVKCRKMSTETIQPKSPPQKARMKTTPQRKRPSENEAPVNVKEEPDDPDLIEIEPDSEPEIVTKTESDSPYMQIDYTTTSSSSVPHTQSSRQYSASSFQDNVPDYSEPGSSRGQGDPISADDYLVYQEDDQEDYADDNDNTEDYSNDGYLLSVALQSALYQHDPSTRLSNYERKRQRRRSKYDWLPEDSSGLYVCTECNYKSHRKCHVVRHRRIHTGDKFGCDVCFRSFVETSSLKTHLCPGRPVNILKR